MPRYYFHIRRGVQTSEDKEGMECKDVEAARNEAALSARELMADRLKSGLPLDGDSFEIADAAGEVLATVRFGDCVL
jgi:hypothetical protein